jgi:hypothetical protein
LKSSIMTGRSSQDPEAPGEAADPDETFKVASVAAKSPRRELTIHQLPR